MLGHILGVDLGKNFCSIVGVDVTGGRATPLNAAAQAVSIGMQTWGLTQIQCNSGHAGTITLVLNRSILARAYIWPLAAFRRLILSSN